MVTVRKIGVLCECENIFICDAESGLYVVGSSVNGFGSNESDMDLCLMLSSDEVFFRLSAMHTIESVDCCMQYFVHQLETVISGKCVCLNRSVENSLYKYCTFSSQRFASAVSCLCYN